MRLTRRLGDGEPSASTTWAAGSVVVRVTERPRSDKATASATATLVLPTPPLPIAMMTPCPPAASSGSRVPRPAIDGADDVLGRGASRSVVAEEGSKRAETYETKGKERELRPREGRERSRHGGKGLATALRQRDGQGIARRGPLEETVQDELLPANPERGQLASSPLGFSERGRFRPAHEHQRRLIGVDERPPRRRVDGLLRLQPRKGPQARRATGAAFEKAGPCGRELEEPQRVPGRRRVEDDVVEVPRRALITKEFRELVERGDLDGARARELLFDAPNRRVGEHSAVRPDDTLPVSQRRGLWIDVHREEARCAVHGPGHSVQGRGEHLVEVRCGIRADQQHASLAPGERQRGRARDRRLSDAALASRRTGDAGRDRRGSRVPQQQPEPLFPAAFVLGPQHPLAAAGSVWSLRTRTPASAASVSRDG